MKLKMFIQTFIHKDNLLTYYPQLLLSSNNIHYSFGFHEEVRGFVIFIIPAATLASKASIAGPLIALKTSTTSEDFIPSSLAIESLTIFNNSTAPIPSF